MIRRRTRLLEFLLLGILASAAPDPARALSIIPEDADRALLNKTHGWDVTPVWAGMGAVPAAALVVSEPLEHNPAVVISVRASSRRGAIMWLLGTRKDGNLEVFPSRELPGDGKERQLLWSIDTRIGQGGPFTGFKIVVGQTEPLELAEHYSVAVGEVGIYHSEMLSTEQLLAATSFAPLTLERVAPRPSQSKLGGTVVVPSSVTSRFPGGKVTIRDGDETAAELALDSDETTIRGMYVKEFSMPLRATAGERRVVTAYLVGADGSSLRLGEAAYRTRKPDEELGLFEVPYQSIASYAVYGREPDLGVITVVRDLYARDEPMGGWTMTHELYAHTVSLATGTAESQPAWRVPAFAHWAEAGFRTVGIGEINDAVAIFVTGSDGLGRENLGLASSAGGSPVRPAISNPIFAPAPEFTGWTEGKISTVRGGSCISYGRTYAMLAFAQAGEEPARVQAGMSFGLREFADAGFVPLKPLVTLKGLGALDLVRVGSYAYSLADDPIHVWSSADPIREWTQHDVALPNDWIAYRLRTIGNKTYVFGLLEYEGRRLLAWKPVEMSGDGVPLPVVVEASKSGS